MWLCDKLWLKLWLVFPDTDASDFLTFFKHSIRSM